MLKNVARIELKKYMIDLKDKDTGTILFFSRGERRRKYNLNILKKQQKFVD